MFKTYVINLNQDMQRFNNLKGLMILKGINVTRFNAIYGKDIDNFDKYNSILQVFLPKSIDWLWVITYDTVRQCV
jgi:hypothetical protein